MLILGTVSSSIKKGDMTLIANTTLTSTSTAITFSSVSGYKDLYLLTSTRSTHSGNVIDVTIEINSSTSNFTSYLLQHNGEQSYAVANPQSGRDISVAPGSTASSNYFGVAETYILNYNSSNTRKSILSHDILTRNASGSSGGYAETYNINWANTSAITSITVRSSAGNLATGSTATLYGIN